MKAPAFFLALCVISCASPAARAHAAPAERAARVSRYYFVLGRGVTIPAGGGWGDRDDGFKPATSFIIQGARKVDETLSYGLETSYSHNHKNRVIADMRVRIFSLTPFLRAAFGCGGAVCYGQFGAGVYQWNQPHFTAWGKRYASDSGSSFGVNLGGGALYPLPGAFRLGLEFRWHHILSVKGENFDLGTADNLVPSALLVYDF